MWIIFICEKENTSRPFFLWATVWYGIVFSSVRVFWLQRVITKPYLNEKMLDAVQNTLPSGNSSETDPYSSTKPSISILKRKPLDGDPPSHDEIVFHVYFVSKTQFPWFEAHRAIPCFEEYIYARAQHRFASTSAYVHEYVLVPSRGHTNGRCSSIPFHRPRLQLNQTGYWMLYWEARTAHTWTQTGVGFLHFLGVEAWRCLRL
jgi:hypothetical protein